MLNNKLVLKSVLLVLSFLFAVGVNASNTGVTNGGSTNNKINVLFETNMGSFTVQLNAKKAPKTVKNFMGYVESGFYAKTIFHRVIPGFMIQGGGFAKDLTKLPTEKPIRNEASNGLHNNKGTIAMARTSNPHSATAQFFINVSNNNFLDPSAKDMGYAVFGKVVDGMDVVDKIAGTKTTKRGMHQNIPVDPILIENVTVIK